MILKADQEKAIFTQFLHFTNVNETNKFQLKLLLQV